MTPIEPTPAVRVIGPALAGILIARVGEAGCFGINAASFSIVIVTLIFLRLPFPATLARRGHVGDDVGDQLGLGGQGFDPRFQQAAAELVQHQGAADQDQQPEHVERQDQTAKPRSREPPPRKDGPAVFSFRGNGIRRHTRSRSRRTRGLPGGTSCASA